MMRCRCFAVFLCVSVCSTFVATCFGALVQLPAADQATSCESSNLGEIAFRCGINHLGPALAAGPNLRDLVQKSAVEFPLVGVAGVSRAEVWLNGGGPCAYDECRENDPVLELHGYLGNGLIEYTDLNVNNLVLRTESLTDPFGSYRFDVTEYTSSLVNQGATFIGFAVRDVAPNSAFASTNNYLYLEAAAVPEPADMTICLTALGLGTCLYRRRM